MDQQCNVAGLDSAGVVSGVLYLDAGHPQRDARRTTFIIISAMSLTLNMRVINALLPILLAAAVVGAALLFVRYFASYEAPGENWAPASPVAGELASFQADLKRPGVYDVNVEKLSSKLPLLFVEYKSPGTVLDTRLELPDGKLRFKMRFIDEGQYRVVIRAAADGVAAKPVFDQQFDVQTPLAKYAVDVLFAVLLLAAGFLSGRQLRHLAAALLLVVLLNVQPTPVFAHEMGAAHHAVETGELSLTLVNRDDQGVANSSPLSWDMQFRQQSVVLTHLAFDLEVIHGESGQPVLALAGVMPGDRLTLRYAPPDGADYKIETRVFGTSPAAVPAAYVSAWVHTEAKSPTGARHWLSFMVLMFPALLGMAWGYWKKTA
jgi:hypothetical protein